MKLYLGLLESARPDQTRIFSELDGTLVDLSLTYAAYLKQSEGNKANQYERGAFCFPGTIAEFLRRGEQSLQALEDVVTFARQSGLRGCAAPPATKCVRSEIRLCRHFRVPKKVCLAFPTSARRGHAEAEIPTVFTNYRNFHLPRPDHLAEVSEEVDADAARSGHRQAGKNRTAEAGPYRRVALLIDIPPRINRREGLPPISARQKFSFEHLSGPAC